MFWERKTAWRCGSKDIIKCRFLRFLLLLDNVQRTRYHQACQCLVWLPTACSVEFLDLKLISFQRGVFTSSERIYCLRGKALVSFSLFLLSLSASGGGSRQVSNKEVIQQQRFTSHPACTHPQEHEGALHANGQKWCQKQSHILNSPNGWEALGAFFVNSFVFMRLLKVRCCSSNSLAAANHSSLFSCMKYGSGVWAIYQIGCVP